MRWVVERTLMIERASDWGGKGEERGGEGKETYNTLGTLNLSIESTLQAIGVCKWIDLAVFLAFGWVEGGRARFFRKGREMVGWWKVDGREGERARGERIDLVEWR